jgi:hypothetical protein
MQSQQLDFRSDNTAAEVDGLIAAIRRAALTAGG